MTRVLVLGGTGMPGRKLCPGAWAGLPDLWHLLVVSAGHPTGTRSDRGRRGGRRARDRDRGPHDSQGIRTRDQRDPRGQATREGQAGRSDHQAEFALSARGRCRTPRTLGSPDPDEQGLCVLRRAIDTPRATSPIRSTSMGNRSSSGKSTTQSRSRCGPRSSGAS